MHAKSGNISFHMKFVNIQNASNLCTVIYTQNINFLQVDTEACEQCFSWLSRYAKITRKMQRSTFLFYVLYMCDMHNLREEGKLRRSHFMWLLLIILDLFCKLTSCLFCFINRLYLSHWYLLCEQFSCWKCFLKYFTFMVWTSNGRCNKISQAIFDLLYIK